MFAAFGSARFSSPPRASARAAAIARLAASAFSASFPFPAFDPAAWPSASNSSFDSPNARTSLRAPSSLARRSAAYSRQHAALYASFHASSVSPAAPILSLALRARTTPGWCRHSHAATKSRSRSGLGASLNPPRAHVASTLRSSSDPASAKGAFAAALRALFVGD